MKRGGFPIIIVPSCLDTHEGQCDCDCACAMAMQPVPLPNPTMLGELRTNNVSTATIPLSDDWFAYFAPRGYPSLLIANGSATEILRAFEQPRTIETVACDFPTLSGNVILETANQFLHSGLLLPAANAGFAVASQQPTVLSVWLHITNACNLACPYCYVHRNVTTMPEIVGKSAVSKMVAIASTHGYKTLKLKYAGGEPTLYFPLVQSLHAMAAHLTAVAGLDLQAVLLTNGINLTQEMLAFLSESGIKLMVSLDGGALTHASQRVCSDGKNSYALVTNAIEHALAMGVTPDISITLTALNLQDAKEAVRFALAHNLPFNLNFYRVCSEKLSQNLAPRTELLTATVLDIFELISSYPDYSRSLTGILDRVRLDMPHSYPCSAGRDYIVVNSTGTLSACQMLLGSPDSMLSSEDPLCEIRWQTMQRFTSVESIPRCQECSWRYACAGGCPLLRSSSLHLSYCRVYRAVLPELAKLEGRRLLANFFSSKVVSI